MAMTKLMANEDDDEEVSYLTPYYSIPVPVMYTIYSELYVQRTTATSTAAYRRLRDGPLSTRRTI